MITMLLGGLWHGAAWTFAVWGMLHGAALCVHKCHAKHFSAQKSKPLITALSIALTNVFIAFCWIFFRAESFTIAWEILYGILTWQEGVVQLYVWVFAALIMVCAGAYAACIKKQKNERTCGFYPVLDVSSFWGLVLFFVELGLIAGLAYTGANPFIYFQF
jgi:alginate O-acetyltransferase complex protein AlgI